MAGWKASGCSHAAMTACGHKPTLDGGTCAPESSHCQTQISPEAPIAGATECRGSESGEAIPAPTFRAHSVVGEEEPLGVVLLLDLGEPRVIVAPKGLLPVLFEVVGLIHVRSALPGNRAELPHAFIDCLRGGASLDDIRLMPRNSWVSGTLPVGHDREREGGQDRRVHRRVLRSRHRVGRSTGEPFC